MTDESDEVKEKELSSSTSETHSEVSSEAPAGEKEVVETSESSSSVSSSTETVEGGE